MGKANGGKFFDELAAILDRVAVFQEPIYVVGDLNIWLDRDDDHNADQLRLLIDCYGLILHGMSSSSMELLVALARGRRGRWSV